MPFGKFCWCFGRCCVCMSHSCHAFALPFHILPTVLDTFFFFFFVLVFLFFFLHLSLLFSSPWVCSPHPCFCFSFFFYFFWPVSCLSCLLAWCLLCVSVFFHFSACLIMFRSSVCTVCSVLNPFLLLAASFACSAQPLWSVSPSFLLFFPALHAFLSFAFFVFLSFWFLFCLFVAAACACWPVRSFFLWIAFLCSIALHCREIFFQPKEDFQRLLSTSIISLPNGRCQFLFTLTLSRNRILHMQHQSFLSTFFFYHTLTSFCHFHSPI